MNVAILLLTRTAHPSATHTPRSVRPHEWRPTALEIGLASQSASGRVRTHARRHYLNGEGARELTFTRIAHGTLYISPLKPPTGRFRQPLTRGLLLLVLLYLLLQVVLLPML